MDEVAEPLLGRSQVERGNEGGVSLLDLNYQGQEIRDYN